MKKIPKRVFALWHKQYGRLVRPLDDDMTNGFMAWPTLREAEHGKMYQITQYYFDDSDVEIVEITCASPARKLTGSYSKPRRKRNASREDTTCT